MDGISWVFIVAGAILGIILTFIFIVFVGRSILKRILEDRGAWDRPLAEPFPKDMVVAVYKRRKWYHRRHRDHYRRHQAKHL